MRLSPEDAHEIARLLALMLRSPEFDAGPDREPGSKPSPFTAAAREQASFVAAARTLFSERKRRAQHFNPAMFSEPAWDMLLALYISDHAGAQQTVGKLVRWIGVPPTTALRWIDYLEKERLVARDGADEDRRIVYVQLTEKGRAALEGYFRALDSSAGLS